MYGKKPYPVLFSYWCKSYMVWCDLLKAMIWLSILYFTASEGRKRDHALSHVSVNVSMQATNHDCHLYALVTFVKNAPYLQSLYKKPIGSVLEM